MFCVRSAFSRHLHLYTVIAVHSFKNIFLMEAFEFRPIDYWDHICDTRLLELHEIHKDLNNHGCVIQALQWRHNLHNGVSDHQAGSRLFTQALIQAQIKENINTPRHLPLCGEFTGDRWIPRTKGQ